MSKARKNTRQAGASAKEVTLKENRVKQALEDLDWNSLQTHIDEAGLDEASLTFLLGHLRRTSTLIMPYPNAAREGRRKTFLNALKEYVRKTLGLKSVETVAQEIALIE